MKNNTILMILIILLSVFAAFAQSTEFVYQGQLQNSSAPANGSFDFEFLLFDASVGGSQIGSTLTRNSVAVAQGIFSVNLDFGASFPGADRFLEIHVRQTGGGGFTPLTPRQLVNSAPYSVKSLSASSADTLSAACIGCVTAPKIASGQVVKGVTVGATTLTDNVTLAAGSNVTITPAGNTLTIAGGVGGNGTTATIPIWSGGTTLANSNITQAGSTVTIGAPAPPAVARLNVYDGTATQIGVLGTGKTGVNGISNGSGALAIGVLGDAGADGNIGVKGTANGTSLIGVYGINNTGIGVQGQSISGVGVLGDTNGISVYGRSFSQGSIALRASGSSWFQGDTSPLNSANTGTGTGIVVGSIDNSTGHFGYMQAFDYSVAQTRVLALNNSGGNVGIGTTTPNQTLEVNGRARVTSIPFIGATNLQVCFNGAGDLIACNASSLKWKTNVQSYRSGLDVIRRLRPISFNWKADGKPDVGLGAEDVAKVAPSFAITDNKGEIEGVRYERLNILLINAVKEQQVQIDRQQLQINVLMKLVNRHHRKATTRR